jgi:hypothetical protein
VPDTKHTCAESGAEGRIGSKGRVRIAVLIANGKGCDFGYALAANSCEGANSVEACTVTALERSPLSRVPNPGWHLAVQSVFSGLAVVSGCPDRTDPPAYFRAATLQLPSFSAVDGRCDFGYALAASSCERANSVVACTAATSRDHRFRGSEPRLTSRNAVGFFGSDGGSGRPDPTDRSAYFRAATLKLLSFSAVDEGHFTAR